MHTPPVIRKTLRVGLYVLGSLLLLIVLVTGGGLLFLRTETAERWVEGLIAEHLPPALAGLGLSARLGRIDGPLPQRLEVEDLRLYDAEGLWLHVPQGVVRLRLTALLRGMAVVDELLVREAALFRLPLLPPAPPEETEPAAEPFSFASLGKTAGTVRDILPRLRLDGVHLNIRVAPHVLGLAPGRTEGVSGARPVLAARKGAADEQPNGNPDEKPDAGLPDASAFPSLTLTGEGPLTAWNADMQADLPGMLRLAGALSLGSGASLPDAGEFGPDLGLLVRIGAHLTEKTLEKPEADSADRDDRQTLPPDVALNLLAGVTDAAAETVAVPDLRLSLPGFSLHGRLGASDTDLAGRVEARLDKPEALTAFLRRAGEQGLPVPAPELPVGGADATLGLAGRPDTPDITLDVRARDIVTGEKRLSVDGRLHLLAAGLLPPPGGPQTPARNAPENVSGTLPLRLDMDGILAVNGLGEDFPEPLNALLDLRLVRTGDTLSLDRFACSLAGAADETGKRKAQSGDSPGAALASLAAEGHFNPATAAARLGLRAMVPSLARLPVPVGGKPSGSLNLSLDVQGEGRSGTDAQALPPLAGTLRAVGTETVWGLPVLDNMLGKQPSLLLDFHLGPAASGSRETEIVLSRLELDAARVKSGGKAAVFLPAGPSEESAGKVPRIDADLKLSLPALAALAPLVPGLAGSLEARLVARGPVTAPAAEVDIESPGLSRDRTVFENLRLRLTAAPAGSDSGTNRGEEIGGQLRVSARVRQPGLTSARGEPLSLSTDWTFRPPHGQEAGEASLARLEGSAPGFSLSGDVRARMPSAPAPDRAGKASALPRLAGKLALAVTDWALVNAAAGLSGADAILSESARLHVDLNDLPSQGGRMNLDVRKLRVAGLSLDSLTTRLEARDIFGTAFLDCAVDLGPGAAADRSWKKGALRVNGPFSNLAASLALDGQTAADLALNLDVPGQKCRVERLRVKDGPTGLGLALNAPLQAALEPDPARRGNIIRVQGLDMKLLPQGSLRGNVLISPAALDVNAALSGVKLRAFHSLAPMSLPDGDIMAEVRLSRTAGAFPVGSLIVRADNVAYPDNEVPPVSLHMDASIETEGRDAPQVRAKATLGGIGPADLVAEVRLPLEKGTDTSGLPRPAMTRPLTGSVLWKGDIAPLWTFVPLADRRVSGKGSLDATLSGTLEAPELVADLQLDGASYEDLLLGILLTDINADIRARSAGESTLSVSLGDGRGGTVSLKGNMGSYRDGLPLLLTGTISRLRPLRRNDLSITLSGDADINGSLLDLSELDVRADITVDEGEFKLVSAFGGSIPSLDVSMAPTPEAVSAIAAEKARLAAQRPPASGPMLDVGVTLPGPFFVRGKGLESEWRGQLDISGPASNPAIEGQISSMRGSFQLLGKDFVLTRGSVLFTGATPPNPSLDIALTHEGPTITAVASVSGPASEPSIQLSSDPPRPQDEVVSQMLFGRPAGSLSRLEALQLANQVRLLTEGGQDLFDTAKDAVGVDVLRFTSISDQEKGTTRRPLDPGAAPTAGSAAQEQEEGIPALEMGKYVMDNVYVGVEQGMNGDMGGVRVEIELTPRFSLEATTSPQGSAIGGNWKKDY